MEWGSVSDWFSAAFNAVMAGVAVYAAKNAKDWLSPKLNERKFKFADELIDNFCKLQQEAFYLHVDVMEILFTAPDDQRDISFQKECEDLYNRQMTYRKSILSLQNEIRRMNLWGLQAKNPTEFSDIIQSHFTLCYSIESSLITGFDEGKFKIKDKHDLNMLVGSNYLKLEHSHYNIIKHYNQLFVD